ncbi:MAG: hypothetical protein KGQ93_00330 [Cyanobacteria bacterium REEB459]|nr:hypothetical protein [Cyanobacteria bacterium REEB459]
MPIRRLEQYTLKHRQEVLIVHGLVAGAPEEIIIFRGFSSSLTRPTAADPDVLILPEAAEITSIDIVAAPYQPDQPQYLDRFLSWQQMDQRLQMLAL